MPERGAAISGNRRTFFSTVGRTVGHRNLRPMRTGRVIQPLQQIATKMGTLWTPRRVWCHARSFGLVVPHIFVLALEIEVSLVMMAGW
jgi:hypothetical protein